MACLNAAMIPRNSPFFPVSVIPRPEIPRPPYIGGRVRGNIPGMVAMIDLFGLEQQPQQKNDRREAAALVEVLKAKRPMTGQRFKSVWDALPPEVKPQGDGMTCQSCIHRLDVTLWGCWLATGCRMGLVICANCQQHKGQTT